VDEQGDRDGSTAKAKGSPVRSLLAEPQRTHLVESSSMRSSASGMTAETADRREIAEYDPLKIPRMEPTRIGHPLFSYPTFPWRQHHQPRSGGTGEPQQRLRVDASFHRARSPFWEGHGGVFVDRSPSGMEERTPRVAAVSRSCSGFTRTAGLEISLRSRHHSSHCDFVVRGRWS
jgi:hypothetical protein